MAFTPLYCSTCGLEILPDQHFIVWKKRDLYHEFPYNCFPYPEMVN